MVRPHNGALQATGPRFGSVTSLVLAGVWGSPRKFGSSLALRTARGPWQAARAAAPACASRAPPATSHGQPFVFEAPRPWPAPLTRSGPSPTASAPPHRAAHESRQAPPRFATHRARHASYYAAHRPARRPRLRSHKGTDTLLK